MSLAADLSSKENTVMKLYYTPGACSQERLTFLGEHLKARAFLMGEAFSLPSMPRPGPRHSR